MARSPVVVAAGLLLLTSGCFLDRSPLGDVDVPPPDAAVLRDASTPRRDAGPDAPDRDGDGVPDVLDICPDDPDPAQSDVDGDGLGDACDDDRDGDLVPNALDVCPDMDSRGTPDEDGDGIADPCDSCPLDANPEQANSDGDRLGDPCEDADPTRFSRVAYLAAFGSSLDGFLASDSDGVSVSDGSLRISSSGERVLFIGEDADHPGDYAVDVRGTYVGPQGSFFPSGTFGALLRWHQGGDRFGYRMDVQSENDKTEILRHDGGGCGAFGGAECVSTLAEVGVSAPDGSAFRLRATTFGRDLSLAFVVGTSRWTRQASDDRYSSGGIGLITDEAEVRINAVAVYAP